MSTEPSKAEQPNIASANIASEGPPSGAAATANTADAGDVEAAFVARILELEGRVAAAESEQAKLKDQALRAMAEAENTRRRIQREAEEKERYALAGFARELASVVDNLRRAVETVPPDARGGDPKFEQFAQGVELTEREFMSILERNGIKRVSPTGQPFDHNLHQAIAQSESADHPAGTVVQVVQAGYTLHGRILRPALVVVAKPPGPSPQAGAAVDTTA